MLGVGGGNFGCQRHSHPMPTSRDSLYSKSIEEMCAVRSLYVFLFFRVWVWAAVAVMGMETAAQISHLGGFYSVPRTKDVLTVFYRTRKGEALVSVLYL